MAWFEIPKGYQCIVRTNDTTLTGYIGSQRHTFVLNGLKWEHTSTQTNTTIPNNPVCVTSPQIPSAVVAPIILLGGIFVICGFNMIYKMIKRTFL